MGLRDLQHFEFGWDLHADSCPTCGEHYWEVSYNLQATTREKLCSTGKKFLDQWFEIFESED